MLGYVYKITNPKGQVYVGSTKDFSKRIKYYTLGRCKSQVKIHNSIRKYGYSNHLFEIIWTGDIDEMLKHERKLGIELNCLDKNKGLNLVLPRVGEKKYIISKESLETRSLVQRGKSHSIEARQAVSKNNKRVKPNLVTKQKTAKALSKKILQFDLNGYLINKHYSCTEAAKSTGIKRTTIKECLNGRNKTGAGFIWKYFDGITKGKPSKKVIQVDISTNEVLNEFKSISEAARYLGFNQKSISRVVNNKGYSAGGFNWRYVY